MKTLEGIAAVSQELKLRCQAGTRRAGGCWAGDSHAGPVAERSLPQEDMARQEAGTQPAGDLPFSHWICQPYVRPG